MKYEINTEERPVLIKVWLSVKTPQRVAFTGADSDPALDNTVYFVRSKGINGAEHLHPDNPIELPMPITPKKLILDINPENNSFGSFINVSKVDVEPLPSTSVVFDKDVLEFYNFIKTYCQKSRTSPLGFYVSKDENFGVVGKKEFRWR